MFGRMHWVGLVHAFLDHQARGGLEHGSGYLWRALDASDAQGSSCYAMQSKHINTCTACVHKRANGIFASRLRGPDRPHASFGGSRIYRLRNWPGRIRSLSLLYPALPHYPLDQKHSALVRQHHQSYQWHAAAGPCMVWLRAVHPGLIFTSLRPFASSDPKG